MPLRVGSANFTKGELAEDLVGRIDVSAYSTALRTARNVTILKYGGVTKRPGTRLVAEVYDATQPVRLLPFQFSLSQTYVMELGQGYMRLAANGAMLIEDRLTITSIAKGATTRVAAAYHDYQIGDQVYFQGIAGMVEINGRIGRVIAVPDDGHFVVNIDSSRFSPFSGDSGGTVRPGPPAPLPEPPPVPDPVPEPEPPPVAGGGYYSGYSGDGPIP